MNTTKLSFGAVVWTLSVVVQVALQAIQGGALLPSPLMLVIAALATVLVVNNLPAEPPTTRSPRTRRASVTDSLTSLPG